MTWLIWRQHRTQTAVIAAVLAAFAVLVVITGLQMASVFHASLAQCAAKGGCRFPSDTPVLGSGPVGVLIEFTLAVPALLGMFLGAPLVAGETETGTSQFIWTQSVPRRRWLAVNVGWLLVAAVVWGGAVSALVTWWSGPRNAVSLNAFNPGTFDVQGVVPVAYSVFAMALGIAAGAVIRRSVPALGVTLGGYFAVRLAIMGWFRRYYLPPVTTNYGLNDNYLPKGAFWQYSQGIITPHGPVQPANGAPGIGFVGLPVGDVPAACKISSPQLYSCLADHGYHAFITYQPASRYWAFQSIESGIFVVLAALLIAAAFAVVRRRDA